jgi:hypothetical protein
VRRLTECLSTAVYEAVDQDELADGKEISYRLCGEPEHGKKKAMR